MEMTMEMPGNHGAILERIGHTIAEIDADIANEPIPAWLGSLLDRGAQPGGGRPQEANMLCALLEALTHPDEFALVERDDELFVVPRDSGTA